MQERIIEIIVYLLQEFQETPNRESYPDLSKELVTLGYTEGEINLAFSWIFNHLQKDSSETQPEFHYANDSIRVLHDLEKLVIEPDAYGYLLQLMHLGMIKEVDLEDVIERALSIGSTQITLEDIKSLAAYAVFNPDTNPSINGLFFHQGTNTIH